MASDLHINENKDYQLCRNPLRIRAIERIVLNSTDTGIIFFYLLLMIILGLYASKKQNSVDDYFVAGGKTGIFSIACLWLAGWIGGASIVGGVDRAYEIGISAGWYIGSMMIGCLTFGLFFAARVTTFAKEKSILTYPELIEWKYDNRTRLVAAISAIASFTGQTAAQLVAAALVLQSLLDIEYSTALILATTIVVLYTTTGGFLAITYTDWVQFTIIFIGVIFIGVPVAVENGGTYENLIAVLPATHFDPGGWGWPSIIAMIASISMGFFTLADSYMRCYSAKDASTAKWGTLLAVAFLLPVMIGVIWLGLTSSFLYPDVAGDGGVLTFFVLQEFPTGLKGLLLAGILAALMSSADICILTASASLTKDIYHRYLNPEASNGRLHKFGMLSSLMVGTVAAVIAWSLQEIIDIVLISFTVSAAALFVPTIAMMYFEKLSSRAAFYSSTCALITVLVWYSGARLGVVVLTEIDPLWPGLIVSLVLFLSGHVLLGRTSTN